MATTTTLLLVLATTATLFFDLAAARCKVMMFVPGLLDSHETTFALKGVVRQGVADSSKIEIAYGAKTGNPTPKTIAVFGKGVKWFEAETDLKAKAGGGNPEADDANKGFYIAYETSTSTSTVDVAGQWTTLVKLDPRGKLSLPAVEWVMFMEYNAGGSTATLLSVYVNQAPSFRPGVTRYANFNGQGTLALDFPSSRKFNFDILSLSDAAVGSSRLYVGTGNYENAVVELEAFYTKIGNRKGDGAAAADGENYIYLSDGHTAAGGTQDKDLKFAVSAHDVDLTTKDLDCASISFLVAFSMTHQKVIFYQKMMMVSDGYYNGKLTVATGLAGGASFAGTVVFGGRKKTSFKIYNIVQTKAAFTTAYAFYGMGDWATEGKAALAAATTAADDSNASPKYYYTSDLTFANADEKAVALKSGHTLGQVKWVAVFDITSNTGTLLAHRDMTKM